MSLGIDQLFIISQKDKNTDILSFLIESTHEAALQKKRERERERETKAFLIKPLDPYANFQKILELKNICYLIHQGGNSQNSDWKTPGLKTKQKTYLFFNKK